MFKSIDVNNNCTHDNSKKVVCPSVENAAFISLRSMKERFQYMRKFIIPTLSVCLAILLCTLLISPAKAAAAEATVNLGTTESFAVLAGSTVTNTGSTVISGSAGGNVGVWPGSAITGFPPATISDGVAHAADAVAQQAQVDLTTAYNDAAGRTVTSNLTGQDLGGLTLTSGVYSFDSSAQLTGNLILDAEGNPDAAFIFQIGSALTTASASSISLINGARYCRVFWQVGSSATLGTSTQFIGHIFALSSITAATGVTVQGQLLARNGAVTLDSNTIINGICAALTPTPTVSPAPTATTAPTVSPTSVPTDTPSPTASPATTAPTPTPTPTRAITTTNSDLPKTGQTGSYALFGLIPLSMAVGLVLLLRRKKTS